MGLSYFKNRKQNQIFNKMTIIYKINSSDNRIKIFGKQFVENNKKNCKILINNNLQEIIENLELNEKTKENNKLEIIL